MYTRASMAMGYEIGVTPVQLAAAYGAIANDGLLMAPTLVREVRDPSGTVLFRHRPGAGPPGGQPRDRGAAPRVPARRGRAKAAPGSEAQLANYAVLGKTGTARRFEDGRYVTGEYTVVLRRRSFPPTIPQLVVIVKIDNPKGSYYGGPRRRR